jgi:hypothetical protein
MVMQIQPAPAAGADVAACEIFPAQIVPLQRRRFVSKRSPRPYLPHRLHHLPKD